MDKYRQEIYDFVKTSSKMDVELAFIGIFNIFGEGLRTQERTIKYYTSRGKSPDLSMEEICTAIHDLNQPLDSIGLEYGGRWISFLILIAFISKSLDVDFVEYVLEDDPEMEENSDLMLNLKRVLVENPNIDDALNLWGEL